MPDQTKTTRPTSRRILDDFRDPLVVVPYLLSIPLALWLPEDALARWSWANAWYDLISRYVPIVANYANRSAFPQVAAVYFSVVIFMAPCVFWALLRKREWLDTEKIRSARLRKGLLYEVPAWLMAFFLVFLAYFGVAMNPGSDFNLMPINRSRIALALFGPLFAGGLSAICLAGSLRFVGVLAKKRT